MRLKLPFAGAFALLVAMAAFPQNPSAVHLSGVVVSLHGSTLVVKSNDGKSVSVALPTDARITENVKSSVAAIKGGDFVGSAAVQSRNGILRAQEVHIFPASMRGAGEGHHSMGPNPNRTMTNGNVTAVHSMTSGIVRGVSGSKDRVLTIAYKGGEQRIEVDSSTPVTRIVLGSKGLLKPGVPVSIFATKTAAGLSAQFISVEKGGMRPQ